MKRRCIKGKVCGSTCIARNSTCRSSLPRPVSRSLRSVINGLFNVSLPTAKSTNDDVLDDVSRMLKGEDPINTPSRKLQVQGLAKALRLGDSERKEIGNDVEGLIERAKQRKEEVRKEKAKNAKLGTAKAQEREKVLQRELDSLDEALGLKKTQKPDGVLTRETKRKARNFDESFFPDKFVKGVQDDYDWENNSRRGKNGKSGGFGSVLFDGDVVVKRGELGKKEIDILKKAGENGIGPRLICGELDSKRRIETFASIDTFYGRVAMEKVKGFEISSPLLPNGLKERTGKTTGDIYWETRARLHRMGIAHNDLHGRNVIVDPLKGTSKLVDFGLAQDNPRAALSEALSAIVKTSVLPRGSVVTGGLNKDVQAANLPLSGLSYPDQDQPANLRKMYSNLNRVKKTMKGMGMSDNEIADVMSSGIRNAESFYNKGAWGKLTNQKAMEIINTLYDGI